MKFGRCIPYYNEPELINGGINSWGKQYGSPLVLISSAPYHGEAVSQADQERQIQRLGAMVVSKDWRKEEDKRNFGMRLLKDCDYVLWNDTDTWIERHQLENLIQEIKETKAAAYCIKQRSYWYDTDHCLVDDLHTPVCAVHRDFGFSDHACVNTPYHLIQSAFVHHISWCKPKNILGKLKNYSHADELTNVDEWYENNWIGWTPDNPAVMPDGKIFDVECKSLPTELRRYL